MSVKNDENRSLPDAFRLLVDTGWKRNKAAEKQPPECKETDWTSNEIVAPERKKAISLRLDANVLDFFRMDGKGYQTRINSVLKAYMKAHQD